MRQFIEGDDNTNLRIKLEDGVVMFQPTTMRSEDTAPLNPRTRGGFEAFIDGDAAQEVLKNLSNPHGPFYILHPSKGWAVATPFAGSGAPPKFEAHVRVWSDSQIKLVSKSVKSHKKDRADPKLPKDPM